MIGYVLEQRQHVKHNQYADNMAAALKRVLFLCGHYTCCRVPSFWSYDIVHYQSGLFSYDWVTARARVMVSFSSKLSWTGAWGFVDIMVPQITVPEFRWHNVVQSIIIWVSENSVWDVTSICDVPAFITVSVEMWLATFNPVPVFTSRVRWILCNCRDLHYYLICWVMSLVFIIISSCCITVILLNLFHSYCG